MPSIEGLGHPLAYRISAASGPPSPGGELSLQADIRSLEGMQKEGLIADLTTGERWRLVSDEGPYLKGTDLAPFPLAFLTAGMGLSFMSELLAGARRAGIELAGLEVTAENFYTMEGSALRGDMIGGALPASISARITGGAPRSTLQELVQRTLTLSPAQAYLRQKLPSTFALVAGGRCLDLNGVGASTLAPGDDPEGAFDGLRPADPSPGPDVVTKLQAAERRFGVEGGVGSSLQAEQKRTLHVRGVGRCLDDGALELQVHLLQPIGSSFRFLGRGEDRGSLPPAEVYLVAGVGFCFMTQIGRYAHIVKHRLQAYRITQRTRFQLATGDEPTIAEPVDTHVFVDSEEDDDACRRLVLMGERTCFLHAALRSQPGCEVHLEPSGGG